MLWPLRLLYIERRYFHLYHPRIVHLCNVKEVAPSIYWSIFSWAGFITFGIRAFDSRVSLLQTGHHRIFSITFSMRRFRSKKKNPFGRKSHWTSGPNFRSCLTIFSEIQSKKFRVSTGSRITSQTGDLGKIVITFSLSMRLKFRKKLQKEDELCFSMYGFQV